VTVRGVDRPPLLVLGVAGAFDVAEKTRLYRAAEDAADDVQPRPRPDLGFVQLFDGEQAVVQFPAIDLPPHPRLRASLSGGRELAVDPRDDWKRLDLGGKPVRITRWEWTGPPGITRGLAFRCDEPSVQRSCVELWEAR
jgi:hypothetical protein